MGKRFKKRFSSLCCCRVKVSDASDSEVKDAKAKTSNQRTCKPAVFTADANRRLLKRPERRLMKEDMIVKKLDNMHECLDESLIDLECRLKGMIRMDKGILQKYVEIMGDFVVKQESAHRPTKVEDVKRKEIVNGIQLKDLNNVLTEDIRRETKALLFDIQKRNKDHEQRFVDGLQGNNLSTNVSMPFVDAGMGTVEAFSRYPITDSPLKYRELAPRIDTVSYFSKLSSPISHYRKAESYNLDIYNFDGVLGHTEYTPTKLNMGTIVHLPVMYEARQTLECARYISRGEIEFYNPPASQESTVAMDTRLTFQSTLDGNLSTVVNLPVMFEAQQTPGRARYMSQAQQTLECVRYMPERNIGLYNPTSSLENKAACALPTLVGIINNYTMTVVRAENERFHLPVSTSGQQSFVQGPVWVISFTPKARIPHSDQHQALVPTIGIKNHVITICVRPLLTRRIDRYGLTKGKAWTILNQEIPFWIENLSVSTLPFQSVSVGYKFTEFVSRRPAIMQVETPQDIHLKHAFQPEKLTDQAVVKVATVFIYDEEKIHSSLPMRVHRILPQRQASRPINGPNRKVHKVISNKDSNSAVTHLVASLQHSPSHTKNKRKKSKSLVTISNVRSLKELCQMVSDKITTPKPMHSENMMKQCLTYPAHTDQEANKCLAGNVASRDTKADEHCGDGDQQGSGGSPRLINENTPTCVLIKTDASPKSDGRQKPKEFERLKPSSKEPKLNTPSRINECPPVAGFPHTERRPKADKYPGTYRQCDKSSRPETSPDGLVPSRSHSKGQALVNVKDESMQDIAKLVSFKTKLPEVKEDLSKVHRFVHNKRPMLSLKHLMGKGFHFEEIHAKFLSINLLHILKFLLDRRIIHADINPEKIVFNNKGYLCLTGYEKSEIIGGCRRDSKFEIPKIEFCSPEQFCKKDDITEATDIFSTGVLAYRMLFGRSPHKDVNYQKTKANLLRDSFIPRFKPDGILSWTGKLFIAHCIRRDPDQRFSIKRCQSSLVDSVKWFKGLNEAALINQTDPSPFSQFLRENPNRVTSGTTISSCATTTSRTTITSCATTTSGTNTTSGIISTSGTTSTSGTIVTSSTTSVTPVSSLQARAKTASSQPTSKLPTKVRTQGMVNRLSSQRSTSHRSQHIVR